MCKLEESMDMLRLKNAVESLQQLYAAEVPSTSVLHDKMHTHVWKAVGNLFCR